MGRLAEGGQRGGTSPSAREAAVSEGHDHDVLEPEQVDLEYDLAHDWADDPRPSVAIIDAPTVCVATETEDQGGDYGYDLAHDVPGR